jgi:NinB protein
MRFARTLTAANRDEVLKTIAAAPLGSRVELKGQRRSLPQNRMMWGLLQAFADQVEHFGQKYEAEDWKKIFMKELGREVQFAPALDGDGIVALGYSSSDLDKPEMADLIELVLSEGAKRGVVFNGERSAA